jgi:predicted small lipoprotein YifL
VNRNYRPTSSGWALILLSATVLALGGCGRKGTLDLPPNASPQPIAAQDVPKPYLATPGGGASVPKAARGVKRPIILDPLLDD